jgi:hypothetical protein
MAVSLSVLRAGLALLPRNNEDLLEFAAESRLMKLQRLQNKVLRTIGNFPRRTLVRKFQIPYVYDYITKSCRQQAEVIQNHENENVRYIGQARPHTENIRGLNLAVMCTTVQVSKTAVVE